LSPTVHGTARVRPPIGGRLAAIDCGTNTVLLTVAELVDGALRPVLERSEITRLGEGLAATGAVTEAAIRRTESAFFAYAEVLAEAGCDRVLAVGTEALRRARNGTEAQARLSARLAPVGATLEIIDGAREAQLVFEATLGSFPELHGRRVVVDVGGGSTELVLGSASIEALCSLPIGSVVLSERFLHSDPPTPREQRALVAAVDAALASAPPLLSHGVTVVGIDASVTTFAAIAGGFESAAEAHGSWVERDELDAALAILGALPLADRRRVRGVDPKRADLIWAGGTILSRVLAQAGASRCLASDRGVRWGLLYEAAGVAPMMG
jgi:exopolyphosphatase/guanosine-5'-triphosphate,3'-diphosphate pyrophosphatase